MWEVSGLRPITPGLRPDPNRQQGVLAGRARGMIFGMVLALAALGFAPVPPQARATGADNPPLIIGYLSQEVVRPPALSNLDAVPANRGLAGARLGLADNQTTGRFLGLDFALAEIHLPEDGDPAAALVALAERGASFVILDLPPPGLDRILAGTPPEGMLLFNASLPDDRLRGEDCRPYLLHTLPSRAMRADALAQYLVSRRWTDWALIVGPRPEDALFAQALDRSAKRFGARIVATKAWTGDHDARRSALSEIPLFTQDLADHDVLLVADEIGDFGDYLMYRTWEPKPVAGTQGLVAAAWGRAVEQWGAAQLQERFLAQSGRPMGAVDWAAWMAVRALGEAATRSRSTDPVALRARILSPALELAGFKGRKLSFRPWDGQLRQPMPLLTPRSVVALAPMEGFLHPHNEMDSLGVDAPETQCATPPGSSP